jgi:hypothetical protein
MAKNGAPPTATKLVYVLIAIAMILLFAFVMIGLHIPTGE